jgi:hypothetical protein
MVWPRPPETPEVDRPDDEDEVEIRTPVIIPEMPPPPRRGRYPLRSPPGPAGAKMRSPSDKSRASLCAFVVPAAQAVDVIL